MNRSKITAFPPFFFAICCILADACTTSYVRVPAVCPRDPFCLDERPDAGADAGGREASFVRRHAEATVVVRASRYVPNEGTRETSAVGVLIGPKGYVLTAYHPIDAAHRITVSFRDPSGAASPREIPAIPLSVSRDEDVALLVLPDGERLPPSLPVRYGPVLTGDDVRFIGAGTAVRRGRVTDASVSGGLNRSFADADVAAGRGDDGAPVLNVCGEVVGVAEGPYGAHRALRFVPVEVALRALSVTPADLR